MESCFQTCPTEMITSIFLQTTPLDLVRLSCVCKRFNQIITNMMQHVYPAGNSPPPLAQTCATLQKLYPLLTDKASHMPQLFKLIAHQADAATLRKAITSAQYESALVLLECLPASQMSALIDEAIPTLTFYSDHVLSLSQFAEKKGSLTIAAVLEQHYYLMRNQMLSGGGFYS